MRTLFKTLLLITTTSALPPWTEGRLCAQNYAPPHDSFLRKIESPDSITKAKGLLEVAGMHYMSIGTNEALATAMKHVQTALDISKAIGFGQGVAVAYSMAGAIYDLQNTDLDKAYESYQAAADIHCAAKDPRCALAQYDVAVVLGKLNRTEEAGKMFEQALKGAARHRMPQEGSMWVAYAKYYDLVKKDYISGRRKIKRAILISDSLNEPSIRFDALKLGAELEIAAHNPAMAVAYLDELVSVADTSNPQLLMEVYHFRSQAHDVLGDYASAYRDHRKMHELYAKIKHSEGTARLKEAEARYETAKNQARIAELTAESRLKTIYLLGALALLLAAGGVSLGLRNRLKIARQRQQLSAQEALNRKLEAERAEEIAVKLEAEKNAETEKNLRLEAEKNAELQRHEYEERLMKEKLTEMSFRFDERRRFIEEAKEKIERHINGKESAKVMEILETGLPDSDPWNEFKAYFDQVHEGFFDRLSEAAPDLSGAEARVAAFIRMNKSIKEAAEILNISPDSVKKTRYRLRKKLDLERDDNLVNYIMKL